MDKLHGEMKRIMAMPEIQQRILNIGLIPQESPPIKGIQAYIRAEQESGVRSFDNWDSKVRSDGRR